MEQIIEKLKEMEGVTYEIIGTWLWVDGETKPHKEELGNLGLHWAPKKKMWYLCPQGSRNFKGRSNMDMDAIRQKYGA